MSSNVAAFVVGGLAYVIVLVVAPGLRFWRALLGAVLLDCWISLAVRYLS